MPMKNFSLKAVLSFCSTSLTKFVSMMQSSSRNTDPVIKTFCIRNIEARLVATSFYWAGLCDTWSESTKTRNDCKLLLDCDNGTSDFATGALDYKK